MGIYGTYGAFNGLGKPSIKLEFEDNDELLAFQQRMQEPDGGNDDPDGGNFTPADKLIDRLSRMATGKPYLKATRNEEPVEGVDYEKILDYYAEPFRRVNFNIWNINKDFQDVVKDKNDTLVFIVKTPLKYIYLRDSQFKKLIDHKREGYFGLIKPTLTDPVLVLDDEGSDVYVKSFYNAKGDKILCFCSVSGNSDDFVRSNHEKRKEQIFNKIKAGSVIKYLKGESHVAYGINGTTHAEPLLIVDFPLFDCKNEINFSDNQIFSEKSLDGYGDFYTVRDMRKRSRKEPGELAANKNLKFEKQKNDTIKNFNKELYAAPTLANGNKEINGKTYYPVKFGYKYGKNDRYISEMYLFIPKIYNASENKMRGSWRSFDVVIDADKLYNIERNPYSGGFQAYEDEATLRENTNNALRQAFADVQRNVDYQKEQIEKEKNSPWKSDGMIAKREKYLKEAYKELKYFIMFYANYGKYPAWIMSDNNGGDYPAKMAEDIPEGYIDRSIFAANLAAPGDLGKTANNTLYNNLEILDYRGMQPTYKQLPDYSQFFAPATNKNSLKGWGLNDTKKLIADICRNHYKECAAIAKHLKAETKLQSAFNLWHWLHHNIRYEYDREGREEVRTPSRTWADRHRGVDCDCLSVFAWCVLKCMGYNPAFELAAFRNKPAYSHIYINLDGIVVDRVWYVFNSRPPGVTKTELFRVGMLDNLGQLF